MLLIYLVTSLSTNDVGVLDPLIQRVRIPDPLILRVRTPDPVILRVRILDPVIERVLIPDPVIGMPRPGGDSVSEGHGESHERHRRVRFTMPRQSRPGGDSRGGVGGHPQVCWDRKFAEVMDAVQSLRVDMMEAIRKSDEKRGQQHQELLDMIRALQGQGQGQTSQSRMDGPPFDDYHGDFSPTGRTTGSCYDRTSRGNRWYKLALLEQVPPPVLPDDSAGTETRLLVRESPGGSVPPVLPHDLAHGSFSQRTPSPVDPSTVRPLKRSRRNSPTHQRDAGRESDTRRERSPLERSPTWGDTRWERSSSHHSPPHRDTQRHRSSSQHSPPHSNPQRQRSSSLRIPPVESSSGACSPPQIQRQLWVRRPDIQWERMFGSGVAAPPKEWSMLKHKWHNDDLKTVRGLVPGNCGAHTLRLSEYLLANKKEFDWKEEVMGTIQEKMAVEVYCNSLHNTVV
ncbi:hypothetical protein LWI28_025755 [Acer negundo]|uniref:Uncharacterized protein n=1 Tax=Acer negundo TaxID=4023 RepID=A0AAD5JEK6_ACENE|nr:hypothetical protein LWI28_025755 [Acer negundo]